MTDLLIDDEQQRKRGRPLFQIPADCESMLVGEGRNDARFLAALARSLENPAAYGHWLGGSSEDGNISAFNEDLQGAILSGGFARIRSFALVLDADRDGGAALKKIDSCMKACFQSANFTHGEVRKLMVRGEEIRVGAFVMPGGADADGNIKGQLEDLVLRAAAQTHQKEMECVRQFRECVLGLGNKPKKERDEEKKKVQAYLSALPENKVYLGVAAEDKVIDFSAPAFDELKRFLKKLSP